MKRLDYIRLLEAKLPAASPKECARLVKKIASLKDKYINGD